MAQEEVQNVKRLTGSERLGMNRNSKFMGAEDIDPGTEPILTIMTINNGDVQTARGYENRDFIVFVEDGKTVPGIKKVKPLIVNATNRKTLRKLYHSVTAETLEGKKIQLYLEHGVRDPSSGEKVDGIRIRPRVPQVQSLAPVLCADCGQTIVPVGNYSAADIAAINEKRFGRKLCAACSKKINEQTKAEADKPATSALAEAMKEEN